MLRGVIMSEKKDIIARIQSLYPTLSKGHKRIADFVCQQYEKAAFMTAAKLGEEVGVSESTVVRFAYELSFEGYPEFQHALREVIKHRLTASQKIDITSNKFAEKDILKSVLSSDIDKLRHTLETISPEEFTECVNTIANAHKVYVLGARTCFSIANFLGFYLNLISIDTRLITTNSASETFEQIFDIGKDDVVIAISYPRYSRRTHNAVKYAHARGSQIIAITDSEISPIVKYSTHKLLAQFDISNFVNSLVAPLSIINALINALAMRNFDKVKDNLNALEHIWEEYEVYEKYQEE